MRLVAIELENFRNFSSIFVEPHPKLNVFCGANAQGKTNLLEAIYLLGTLRSFRTMRIDDMVRFAAAKARVEARVERAGLERRYQVELTRQPPSKRARVDGKGLRSAAEYFGGFNVVLFAPEDLRLVRGGPSDRRRFLDRAVWNATPGFLSVAQTYERTLRSRNALLRAERIDEALLEVFDEQLAEAGAVLVNSRRGYLEKLAPLVGKTYEKITQSHLDLNLVYVSKLTGDIAAVAQALRELLRQGWRRDRERGFTSAGPHGDDLEFELDGRPARLHASQGQTRALVLALKLAEIGYLSEILGESPIFLVDDVSSELDAARTKYLLEFIAGLQTQTYLTTTMPGVLPLPKERQEFQLVNGAIQG